MKIRKNVYLTIMECLKNGDDLKTVSKEFSLKPKEIELLLKLPYNPKAKFDFIEIKKGKASLVNKFL